MKIKKILPLFGLVAMSAIFVACDSDNDSNERILNENEIPSAILTYKNQHFPQHEIIRAVQDNERNGTIYEIYLNRNLELDFNGNLQIIDIDGSEQLPDSVIPSPILTYVNQNYSGNYITDWELERNHQQIGLNNGIYIEFDMDGSFIRIDND